MGLDIGKSINDKVEKLMGGSANKVISEKIEKAKVHLKENKNIYIAGGVGLIIGATFVSIFKSQPNSITVINNISYPYRTF